jgi:hypothetical protein
MVVDRGVVGDSSDDVLRLYVDGVQRASSLMSSVPLFNGTLLDRTDTQFIVGGNFFSTQFEGLLDEIRIVNFVRTTAQINDTWFGTNSVAMSPGIFTSLQKALVARDKEKPIMLPMPPPKPPVNLPPPDTGRSARASGGGK